MFGFFAGGLKLLLEFWRFFFSENIEATFTVYNTCIRPSFTCRPSDYPVSKDVVIEPRAVATFALTVSQTL